MNFGVPTIITLHCGPEFVIEHCVGIVASVSSHGDPFSLALAYTVARLSVKVKALADVTAITRSNMWVYFFMIL